jgi:S1-C subfamily serine protease
VVNPRNLAQENRPSTFTVPVWSEVRSEQRSGGALSGLLISIGWPKANGRFLVFAWVCSAVFFPPALIAVVVLADTHAISSYDLVVGVDGNRVRDTMEFMQSVADVRSGDTVYLAVVRHGRRVQIPIHLP